MDRYQRSQQLWNSRSGRLLNGVLTMSKSPAYISPGAAPIYVAEAKGAYFWDVDGNKYLDFPMALGAVVLGHADARVAEAVTKQLQKGPLFSLSSELELDLADRLAALIPCAEMVRFLKTGSEAMSAAVRVARAYTKKELVAVCGYHGWHDWTVARSVRNAGVPESLKDLVLEFKFNDLESLELIFSQHPGEIAAVSLEPVAMEAPTPQFLQGIKDLCQKNKALLIFDEVITGFRLDLGGAQRYFGITPDLAAFGKAMANGFPISALVGRREILSKVADTIFISSTHGGELLSISAALETISILERENGCERLLRLGRILQDGLNQAAKKHGVSAICSGMPHKTFLTFLEQDGFEGKAIETFFRQRSLASGVFLGYGHFTSLAHTEQDLANAISVAEKVFSEVAEAIKDRSLLKRLPEGQANDVFKRFR